MTHLTPFHVEIFFDTYVSGGSNYKQTPTAIQYENDLIALGLLKENIDNILPGKLVQTPKGYAMMGKIFNLMRSV